MKKAWYNYLIWVPAAGVLGFTTSTIFAGMLHLSRYMLVIPYAVLIGIFVYA